VAIGIICRNCGARLKVAEKAVGKLGKCPKCKQAIRVPKTVSPQAHFCDRCEKTLAEEKDIHLVAGKIYCGKCYEKIQGKKKRTGDPILDEIGFNIPGMVVLRGSDQRKMGRMLQDVSAKKDFKDKSGEAAKSRVPVAEEDSPQEEHEDEPVSPEEAAAAGIAVAPPPSEPPAVEEAPPEAEKKPVESEKKPPPVIEPPTEKAPEPPAKLGKGQRPADPLLTKLLIEQGVVLDGELELALQYQTGLGKRLIPVLDDLKLTSEEDVARAIAESTGLERCPPGELDVAVHVEDMLDDEIMGRYEVVPLSREDDALIAAFPNPLDTNAVKGVRDAVGMRVIPRVCTWTQYTEARHALKTRS
jgi:hypothetical protein